MVTNETQEQLEARGWDFTEEFIPDEPTVNNQDKTVDVSENGTIEVTPDEGFTGLGKVTVNTNVEGECDMEYRDVSSLSSVRKLNLLENIAFMAKASTSNEFVIITPAFEMRTYIDAGAFSGDNIVAVFTNLNTLKAVRTGDVVDTLTLKDLLIDQGWLDSWNSCPVLTKEQFYDLNA